MTSILFQRTICTHTHTHSWMMDRMNVMEWTEPNTKTEPIALYYPAICVDVWIIILNAVHSARIRMQIKSILGFLICSSSENTESLSYEFGARRWNDNIFGFCHEITRNRWESTRWMECILYKYIAENSICRWPRII